MRIESARRVPRMTAIFMNGLSILHGSARATYRWWPRSSNPMAVPERIAAKGCAELVVETLSRFFRNGHSEA